MSSRASCGVRPSTSTGSLHRRAARRLGAPASAPSPLIAPVPRPILADKSGRSVYNVAVENESDEARALRTAAAHTAPAGGSATAALRLLVADMMLGLRDEHAATLGLASYTPPADYAAPLRDEAASDHTPDEALPRRAGSASAAPQQVV